MYKIAFKQMQLDELLRGGTKKIFLCDNDFVIGLCRDVCYRAIGDVRAKIACSEPEAVRLGIVFENFSPEFTPDEPPIYANVPHGIHPAIPGNTDLSLIQSSFASSFAASFSGSFVTSFSGSFSSSFVSSFYEMYGYESGSYYSSFSSSFRGSFSCSAASIMRLRKNYVVKEIAVNGYGLNLI